MISMAAFTLGEKPNNVTQLTSFADILNLNIYTKMPKLFFTFYIYSELYTEPITMKTIP